MSVARRVADEMDVQLGEEVRRGAARHSGGAGRCVWAQGRAGSGGLQGWRALRGPDAHADHLWVAGNLAGACSHPFRSATQSALRSARAPAPSLNLLPMVS